MPATLEELGERYSFETEIIAPVVWRKRVISSSEIRRADRSGRRFDRVPDAGPALRAAGAVVRGRRQRIETNRSHFESRYPGRSGAEERRVRDADARDAGSRANGRPSRMSAIGPRSMAGIARSKRTCFPRWTAPRPKRFRWSFCAGCGTSASSRMPEALKAQILRDVNRAQTYFRQAGCGCDRRAEARMRENLEMEEAGYEFIGRQSAPHEGALEQARRDRGGRHGPAGQLEESPSRRPRALPRDQVTDEMMSEFKIAVSKVLTPHASAILLDPEYGLPAAKARSSNAGLLLAYEESGYDNTKPGRLPDLLPHVSAKRIADWGANAVKILLYYSPFDDAQVNDIKHAFIERIGAECETVQIPFFLRVRGLRSQGRR